MRVLAKLGARLAARQLAARRHRHHSRLQALRRGKTVFNATAPPASTGSRCSPPPRRRAFRRPITHPGRSRSGATPRLREHGRAHDGRVVLGRRPLRHPDSRAPAPSPAGRRRSHSVPRRGEERRELRRRLRARLGRPLRLYGGAARNTSAFVPGATPSRRGTSSTSPPGCQRRPRPHAPRGRPRLRLGRRHAAAGGASRPTRAARRPAQRGFSRWTISFGASFRND